MKHKNFNYYLKRKICILAFISIFMTLILFTLFYNLNSFAIANESETETTHTIKGKIIDTVKQTPIENIYICPMFHYWDLQDTKPDPVINDVVTQADGTFVIAGVPDNTYGAIWIFAHNGSGVPTHDVYESLNYPINEKVTSDVDLGDICLSPLMDGFSGTISDTNGKAIKNAYIEFLNPCAVTATIANSMLPLRVLCVTDENGYFCVSPGDNISNDWYRDMGLAIGREYQVNISSIPPNLEGYTPPGPCSKNLMAKSLNVVFNADGTNSYSKNKNLDVAMDTCFSIKLYDYNQTTEHCVQWYHKMFINGQDQGVYNCIGDCELTVPSNAKLSFGADCSLILSFTYSSNEYNEYFIPVLKNLNSTDVNEEVQTYKALNWRIWKNVANPTWDNYTSKAYFGDSFNLDDSFKTLCLDTEFGVDTQHPEININADLSEAACPAAPETFDNMFNIELALSLLIAISLFLLWVSTSTLWNSWNSRRTEIS